MITPELSLKNQLSTSEEIPLQQKKEILENNINFINDHKSNIESIENIDTINEIIYDVNQTLLFTTGEDTFALKISEGTIEDKKIEVNKKITSLVTSIDYINDINNVDTINGIIRKINHIEYIISKIIKSKINQNGDSK